MSTVIERLAEILPVIRPGAEWSLHGNVYEYREWDEEIPNFVDNRTEEEGKGTPNIVRRYEGLIWHDAVQPKPTVEECLAGLEKLEALDYKLERQTAYDPIGDQLDRITKALEYLKNKGIDIGPDGIAQVTMVNEVKAEFPKQ